MKDTKVLLKCKDLGKTFGKAEILKNVNLEVESGKIVGILGKNGAGKSTLLKLINGLLTPTTGKVTVCGKKIGVESKKKIAFLPERNFLDVKMTIGDTLKYFADFYDDFDSEKAKKLIADLDLKEEMQLAKISKGMQEKVRLVLIMSRRVKLYILDEPLGGIDPASRDYILDTILQNFDEGSSMIISTHLISDIEHILDEVVFIDNGTIHSQYNAEKLRHESGLSIDGFFRKEFKDAR